MGSYTPWRFAVSCSSPATTPSATGVTATDAVDIAAAKATADVYFLSSLRCGCSYG